MGNINGSFVQKQIQNLNQVKETTQTPKVSQPVESIGQTEFQARKAMFEKTSVQEKTDLGDEMLKTIESRIDQVSSQELSETSQLLRPSTLTKQIETEENEIESGEMADNAHLNLPPGPSQVNEVNDEDEVENQENEAEQANLGLKPVVNLQPQVNESETLETEDNANLNLPPGPRQDDEINDEDEVETQDNEAEQATLGIKPVVHPYPQVNESEEQEIEEGANLNIPPSPRQINESEETEDEIQEVNRRPSQATQIPNTRRPVAEDI